MNESLISGLLGAVMGGATSIEKSLAEEEAARRKEEEEKRREERAITLAERQEAMKEARKAAQEKARAERIASYVGPETQITPGTNPMEPEASTSSKVQLEQRLTSGIEAAISKGDTEAAKLLSDQYTKLTGEKRAQAKEERDVAKALAEPMEKIPERIKVLDELTGRFYKQSGGGYDEEGNPTDAKAFASASKKAEDYVFLTMRERMGIAPGAAGTPGQRPPTAGQLMAAEGRIGTKVKESFTEGFGEKKKVNQDLVDRAMPIVIDLIDKSDPSKKLDVLKIQNDAISQVRSARKKAEDYAGSQWDALKDKGGVTRSRYIERNYLSYIDDYLSGGRPQEQESSTGTPWTRSWRQ